MKPMAKFLDILFKALEEKRSTMRNQQAEFCGFTLSEGAKFEANIYR